MKILWVATKAPWPPRDGGRLLLWNTLRALAATGHRIELVAPFGDGPRERVEAEGQLGAWCTPRLVGARPRSVPVAFLRSWVSGEPWTLERHQLSSVRRVVATTLAGEPRDLVVAEQLQALQQASPVRSIASQRRPRLLLRAQNVESDLWAASAISSSGLRAGWLRAQARRLRRFEGAAVRSVDATVALTARDAATLTELSGSPAVSAIPAPFEGTLPAGERELSGQPAVLLLGSAGWAPNDAQARYFAGEVWPEVLSRRPGARLHVFGGMTGGGAPGIESWPAPDDSRDAFPPRAILAVPLEVASGVRMKILEAWARGIAVVGSPAAVAGLEPGSERAVAVARSPAEWAAAIDQLAANPGLVSERAAAGREVLARWHAPDRVARAWGALLAQLESGAGGST